LVINSLPALSFYALVAVPVTLPVTFPVTLPVTFPVNEAYNAPIILAAPLTINYPAVKSSATKEPVICPPESGRKRGDKVNNVSAF
jgi:hypothetical protein